MLSADVALLVADVDTVFDDVALADADAVARDAVALALRVARAVIADDCVAVAVAEADAVDEAVGELESDCLDDDDADVLGVSREEVVDDDDARAEPELDADAARLGDDEALDVDVSVATDADAAFEAAADAVEDVERDAIDVPVDVGVPVDEAVLDGVGAREIESIGDDEGAPEGRGVALTALLLLDAADDVDDALEAPLVLVVAVAVVEPLATALIDCDDVVDDDAVGAEDVDPVPVVGALAVMGKDGPELGLTPLVAVAIDVEVDVELAAALPVARGVPDVLAVTPEDTDAAALEDAAPVPAVEGDAHADVVPVAVPAADNDADDVDECVGRADIVALKLPVLDFDAGADADVDGLGVDDRERNALLLGVAQMVGRVETLTELLAVELPLALLVVDEDAVAAAVDDAPALRTALSLTPALAEFRGDSVA